ncbi:MAG: hypothetical protein WBC30_12630, partial [Candidatus Sulfotelmatobacter sp.]
MPAEVLAVTLAVGERGHSNKSRVERVSENQHPTMRAMAGQERRIDDTILIREAQSGNRAAFEE